MPIFGTAGARGVFNRTQTPQQVYELVETAAFVFGKGKYVVGLDGRKSSTVLARVVASAIAAAGSEAIEVGLAPTPVIAFSTRQNGANLGFAVTASHNPPEFSGVKVFDKRGMELSKEDEGRIERGMIIESVKTSARVGSLTPGEAIQSYLEAIAARFSKAQSSLRLVVDCATGPAALVTPQALSMLGHKVVPINTQVSWRFTARHPEPTRETLEETASFVGGAEVDLGFAHDGDGDRLVLVNRAGRVLPDYMTSVLALHALDKSSGVVVISENSSFAVEETAERMGLKVVRGRIGKTFAEIDREGAVMATEPTKVVDPSWGMWEDGIYTAVLIADLLSRKPETWNMLEGPHEWLYRQINLPLPVDLARVSDHIEEYFGKYRIVEQRNLDGLRVVFKDKSWVMFRPSGTEPKTRIYCEARDELRLSELLEAGKTMVERSAKPAVSMR